MRSIPRNGQSVPRNGQGIPRRAQGFLRHSQGRPRHSDGSSRSFESVPTISQRSARSSSSIRRDSRRRQYAFAGLPYEDHGMLHEERRKPSELVGEPETHGETPSAYAGTLSVFGRRLSELAELPSLFVRMPSAFREPPSARGRMLHSFLRMPCAFGRQPSAPRTAAPGARRYAREEPPVALRKPRDALR